LRSNKSVAKNKGTRSEKYLRLKEAWFAAGTSAFERVFPMARARTFPDLENPYVCPLCRRPFVREALANGTLTFEDAPPRSYGGRRVALTCKPCNNSFGSSVDASLARYDSEFLSPCKISVGGVEVRAYQELRSGGRHFSIPEKQNDPKAVDRFNKNLGEEGATAGNHLLLTLKWDQLKRRRADVAWLKSALIVAFATWGYMYAFAPALKVVQRQLEQFDEIVIPHFKLTNLAAPRTSRGLFYVRQPRGLEGVAVWMGQHIVLLPPHGRDTNFYERIEPLIGRADNISLQGDAYHWPTGPKHTLDVQAFDSPLVLPTPAEVHLFT
jgi:hypothetical protein